MLTETKYCLALGALVFRKDLLEAATGDLKKKKKRVKFPAQDRYNPNKKFWD